MLVLRDLFRILSWGLVLGMAGLVAFSRILTSMLYGIHPVDLLALVTAAGTLILVALCAAYGPCHRVLSVSPVTALR